MPLCPHCNQPLDLLKDSWVCPPCGFTCPEDRLNEEICRMQQAHKPWFQRFGEEDALWHQDAMDAAIPIVSHEYCRLKELLVRGSRYGALPELKDNFEVLLKFPALILASALYHKVERSDRDNKVLIALMEKPLALGDWTGA